MRRIPRKQKFFWRALLNPKKSLKEIAKDVGINYPVAQQYFAKETKKGLLKRPYTGKEFRILARDTWFKRFLRKNNKLIIGRILRLTKGNRKQAIILLQMVGKKLPLFLSRYNPESSSIYTFISRYTEYIVKNYFTERKRQLKREEKAKPFKKIIEEKPKITELTKRMNLIRDKLIAKVAMTPGLTEKHFQVVLKKLEGKNFAQIARELNLKDRRNALELYSRALEIIKAQKEMKPITKIHRNFWKAGLTESESIIVVLRDSFGLKFREIARMLRKKLGVIFFNYKNGREKLGKPIKRK